MLVLNHNGQQPWSLLDFYALAVVCASRDGNFRPLLGLYLAEELQTFRAHTALLEV